MKLKLNQTIQLLNTLASLDGYNTVIDKKVVICPYNFSGKTRWNLAKNISVLKKHAEVYETARLSIIKSLAPDGNTAVIDNDPALRAKFIGLHNDLLNQEDEVEGLLKISAEDVLRDGNQIPSTVISVLTELDMLQGEVA